MVVLLIGMTTCQRLLWQGSKQRWQRGMQNLIKATQKNRPIEARLTGGFLYAPYQTNKNLLNRKDSLASIDRGSLNYNGSYTQQDDEETSRLILLAAADILTENAEYPTIETTNAAGLVSLMQGDFNQAISYFERANQKLPTNGHILNNLSAAYLTRAEQQQQPQDLLRAISSADAAVALDKTIIEAHFNRALALEKISLMPVASQAWQEYIQVETTSAWMAEAQTHLIRINSPLPDKYWPQEQIKLNQASRQNNRLAVTAIVKKFPHLARVYATDELLLAWAEAQRDHRKDEAEDTLQIARAIAAALVNLQDDHLLEDAIAAIDRAILKGTGSSELTALMDAYQAYCSGRKLMEKFEAEKAAPLFDQAINGFSRVKDPAGESLATLQKARCDNVLFNYQRAIISLKRICANGNQNKYRYIVGRALWVICHIKLNLVELTEALTAGIAAVPILELSGDQEATARVQILVAQTYNSIGDFNESWRYQYNALKSLSKVSSIDWLSMTLNIAAENLIKMNEYGTALYFQDEAIRVALHSDNEALIANTYLVRSSINNKLGNHQAAEADLNNAKIHCARYPDNANRKMTQLQIEIIEGDFILKNHPTRADEIFSKVLTSFQQTNRISPANNLYKSRKIFAAHLYLSRAHACLASGNITAAGADLKNSIAEFETVRANVGDNVDRISYFETPQSAYDEMIKFQIDHQNDIEVAFNYAETARARVLLDLLDKRGQRLQLDKSEKLLLDGSSQPLTLPKIQKELPSNVTMLEYALLDDRVVTWIIRNNQIELIQTRIPINNLERIVNDYLKAIEHNSPLDEFNQLSTSLYKILFQPIIDYIPPTDRLIILPDKSLHNIPFSTLLDAQTRHYLIQDYSISIAPSANVYIRCLQRDNRLAMRNDSSALVIGNPRFNRKQFPTLAQLTNAEKEATYISATYPNTRILLNEQATKSAFLNAANRYSIVHFSGHAIMDAKSPLYSTLVFAPESQASDEDSGTLRAYELYRYDFTKTRLVVLAACNTGNGYRSGGEGIASLARPFIASGVPAVVASLWQADDRASAQLFINFHERLKSGEDAATALRSAQLSLLNSTDQSLRVPKMWAAFVLLGGVKPLFNHKS